MSVPAASLLSRKTMLIWIALLGVAAALRAIGLGTDFWLDEIWSWALARSVSSWPDIFTSLHQDNNNYLNTAWMFVCGDTPHWWIYRLPAFTASLLTVGGVFALTRQLLLGRDETPPAGTAVAGDLSAPDTVVRENSVRHQPLFMQAPLWAMGLLSICAYAAVYGSEARGYAPAACAGVFCLWLIQRVVHSPDWRAACAFGVIATVGFLFHLTFLTVYLPALLWSTGMIWHTSTTDLRQRSRSRPRVSLSGRWSIRISDIGLWLCCHLLPIGSVALLWWIDLQYAQVGGGPELNRWLTMIETLSWPAGVMDPLEVQLAAGLLVVTMLAAGLMHLWVIDRSAVVLCGLLLVSAPLILFGLAPSGLVYPRHFFVAWMAVFPLLGIGIAGSLASRHVLRLAAMILLVVWPIANGWEMLRFATAGRGGYGRAVQELAAESVSQAKARGKTSLPLRVTVISDHDFRNGMLLGFYSRFLPADVQLDYQPQPQWTVGGADWLIVHSLERSWTPDRELELSVGRFELWRQYPFAGPVGWHWAVYRRISSP